MLTRHRTRLYDVNEIGAEENNNYDVLFLSHSEFVDYYTNKMYCRLSYEEHIIEHFVGRTCFLIILST